MAKISEVIPDILDRKETLALGGVPRPYSKEQEEAIVRAQVMSVDGIYVGSKEARVAYGDQTREDIFGKLTLAPQKWVFLYGGWNNGLTLLFNICRKLAGNVPLGQIRVKHVIEAVRNGDGAPIFYDYATMFDTLSGWKTMLAKGITVTDEQFANMTLAHLLLEVGGAPARWSLMVNGGRWSEVLSPPTTSLPFPGAEYGNGFIHCDLKSEFPEGLFGKKICNTTGSRSVDSIALANLLVHIRHGQKVAFEKFVEDAAHRREEMEKKKPGSCLYAMKVAERYAGHFTESQLLVVDDIRRILEQNEPFTAFQYAVDIVSRLGLPTAMNKVSGAVPYAWVKFARGWCVASD